MYFEERMSGEHGPRRLRQLIFNKKFQVVSLLVGGIFLFVCSLEGVGYGFKLMFSEWASIFLSMVESGVAPFTGLAIGMLATTLLESSSAVVATTMMAMGGMVASGLPLSSALRFGIPMVLGANIGTTVGNTITLFAIRKSTTKEEFNSTIPGVLVDDIYKFLTIGILFPIEVTTGFLSMIGTEIGFFLFETLKLEGVLAVFEKTIIDIFIEEPIIKPIGRGFSAFFGPQMGGILFFVLWFAVVIVSIDFLITKGLKGLIQTDWAERVSSAFHSPYKSFGTGFSITWIVGSSSIGTSLAIPMIATKMVSLEEAFPYLCGCSIATTLDLAQLYGYVAGGLVGVMLGTGHVVLNTLALVLWLVTPLRVIPIKIAKWIGRFMSSKRYSALYLLGYALSVFLIIPLIVVLIL
jgi:sodium-dependent phosphate cotransporter